MLGVALYGILDTGYVASDEASDACRKMLEGGVQAVQLRAKRESRDEILQLASVIGEVCRRFQAPFILNDFPDLAREVGADAVHVGQDDVPIAQAREMAGAGVLVGKSTHSVDQAVAAQAEGADYIGFGPLFATPTKPDYVPIGVEDLGEVHRKVDIPIFCIGGIKESNLDSVIQAGARRVVMVSGLLQSDDIADYARRCRVKLERNETL